jgi:peptidoglycan hydrolase CwlO-like protein
MMAGPQSDNPYPGLRAFEPDEAELFFGRERESDELRRRLRTTRFLAVVGSSGSGKSSLVRCGLIPSLHGGFMAGRGSSWRVAITRPGTDPIEGLAETLNRPEVLGNDAEGARTRRTVLEVMLRDSSLGLAEAVRQAQLPAGDNLLLLVDQFEELFRFRRTRTARAGGDDAAAYVRLLIEASRQEHLPIFVALTMRSEFIGECLTFDRLPEAINAGQYLIPRMSRDALRAAVAGPAAVCGATMAPRLLARLLNEVGDDLDRLPVLQHALMRTWQAWARDHTNEEPIDIRHYEAIGTMSEALSRHADEAYAELGTASERRIAERLFKTLTETTEDGHGVRRPTATHRLADVCAASISELEGVIDRFRAPGRAFLQPPAGVRLQSEDVIDISHESLMRLWTRLAGWVREEGRAVDIYRRLSRSAAQHAAGEGSLWRPPELTLGLRWLRETQPSAAWAGDPATFERVMGFLRRSRRAHLLKITLAFIGAATAVALTIGYFHREARRQRDENVQLQREVDRLQAHTADAGQAGQTQSAQVQSLRERRAGLQSEVDRLQRARGELDGQVTELREANRGLEADLTRISSDMTRLRERRDALQAEFVRLGVEQRDLSQRTERLERATPALQAQVSAGRVQVDALLAQNRMLQRLVRETRPCPRASMPPPPPIDRNANPSAGAAASSGAAPPEPVSSVPPDHPSSDALRKRIEELTRELARLLQERARLQDEAGFLEQENALLDRQRQTLTEENERMAAERWALEERQRALRDAVRLGEAERNELAARVEEADGRNRTKREQVTAARQKHREVEDRAVAEAGLIADQQSHAERLRADNTRLAGILTPHVDRLITAARSPQTPADLAALLALQAWRWAPYDTDDPAQPAIYNTLWQVLRRRDQPAALRLLAPDDSAGGRLATARTQVMAAALCERVTRPLTGDEWRRFMPEGACFTEEAARPCAR